MSKTNVRRPFAALVPLALVAALLAAVPAVPAHAQSVPTLAIEDVQAFSSSGPMVFSVKLSQTSSEAVRVEYQTFNGSALAGTHYGSTSGVLEVAAGSEEGTIPVPLTAQTSPDRDRKFTVQLSAPQNATIARGTATGTIWNAGGPTIRFKEATRQVNEPADGATREITFTVEAQAGSGVQAWGGPVEVRYRTADVAEPGSGQSKARAGVDYDAVQGTLVIPAPPSGETTSAATIQVTVHGNTIYQGGDSAVLSLELFSPAFGVFRENDQPGGTLTRTPRQAHGLIKDNDAPPTVTIGSVAVAEGNSGTTSAALPITLSHPSILPIKLVHATADGTATVAGDDYVPVAPDTPVPEIPPLQTKASVSLKLKGDKATEPNEDFFVDFGTAAPADPHVNLPDEHKRATVTILNDDGPYLTIDDVEDLQGDDGDITPFTFTVRLRQVPSDLPHKVTVDFKTVDGTARTDQPGFERYKQAEGTLEFPPGVTERTVTVDVIGNDRPGFHQTFFVDLSNVKAGGTTATPPAPTLFKARGVGTILNDDGPELTVANALVVRDQASLLDATFQVRLSEPLDCPDWFDELYSCDVRLRYRTADGTAKAGQHYHAKEGTLRIPRGETKGSITVKVFGSDEPGPSHTFGLKLEPAELASSRQRSVTGEIRNGVGPALTVGDVTMSRPRSGQADAVFPVTLKKASPHGVSLAFRTVDDSAVAGRDYVARTGIVKIPAGRTSGEIVVPVMAATSTPTPQASFNLALSQPGYAVLATDVAKATLAAEGGDAGGGGTAPGPAPGQLVRTSGKTRIATAVAIAREFWASAEDVVIATAGTYPDALSAGALSADLDAPLLLTPADHLHEDVAAELERLGAKRAWVMGGTAAISQGTEDALVAAGLEVRRLGGSDRFATAALVAAEVGAEKGEALIALGAHAQEHRAWPDALSAGALAASGDRLPTLLTHGSDLPAPTAKALGDLGVERVYVVGGPAAISEAVAGELQALGLEVVRLAGADRFATSVAVVTEALRRNDLEQVPIVFATGMNFPDGLAAAGLTARLGGVLLLVPGADLSHAPAAQEFLAAHGAKLGGGVVTGGAAAVSDEVFDQLRTALAPPGG